MAKINAQVVLKYSTVYPFRVDGKSVLCVYCQDKFEDPTEFRTHMEESHQTFKVDTAFEHRRNSEEFIKVDCTNLRCRICAEPFKTINEIAEHLRDFHEYILDLKYDVGLQPYKMKIDSWTCFLCDLKLPSLTKLARHTTTHYQKSTCEMCGRNYLSQEALKYHMKCSHSGKIVCRKCWDDFPTIEKKKEHVRNSVRCWPFSCVHCKEKFMSWDGKVKHLTAVHGKPLPTYDCPECGKKFNKRKPFYMHFKKQHTDDSLECTLCGYKFECKSKLDEHMLGHTGEKHFMCTVCSKSFSRKKGLIQHMWIHSEEKRFQCIECDKSFAQKVSLKAHLKSHHPDVAINL